VLAREYGRINHPLLFEAANRRLPALIRRLQKLLERI
jgi:uncharacterized protein with HEPN domain